MMQESENFDISKAKKLAATPEGQQLLSTLRSTNGNDLQIAIAKATLGDYTHIQKILENMANNPDAKKLIDALARQANE